MPIAPPAEHLLMQPEFELMDLYGRMRSLAEDNGFFGTLPVVWQCSDESQMIKKALLGYVFDCPTFNLGRVGALLDPTRLLPASHHGRDLVIFGGSHVGAREENGIGLVERVHGEVAPCCGKLRQVLWDYLQMYRRAASLITLSGSGRGIEIEIPYKYLFHKPPSEMPRLQLNLKRLIEGTALREGSHGKLYRLNPEFADQHAARLADITEPRPIGPLLDAERFAFSKRLDPESMDPIVMLEYFVFDFLPDIVTSEHPHRRLADINTWRQFHRLASYLTDFFDSGERNILVVAGLTLDHSIRRNTFVAQFGFTMERGRPMQARYFSPEEINQLLLSQPVYQPRNTFLEYAGVSAPPPPQKEIRPRSAKLT